MAYEIANHNREVYAVNDSGEISRPRINLKPSGRWRALALVRFSNLGHVAERVPFELWDQFVQQGVEWRYKNGKPRYFLEDWDHGTTRVHVGGVITVRQCEKNH